MLFVGWDGRDSYISWVIGLLRVPLELIRFARVQKLYINKNQILEIVMILFYFWPRGQ